MQYALTTLTRFLGNQHSSPELTLSSNFMAVLLDCWVRRLLGTEKFKLLF